MRKCQHSISKLSGAFKTPVNYPFINPDCLFHDAVTASMEAVILLSVLFKDNVCVAFCLSNATLTDGGEVGGGTGGGLILSLPISEGRLLLIGLKCLGREGVIEALLFFVCGKNIHLNPRRVSSILTELFRNPETDPDVERFSVLPKCHLFGQLLV